MTMYTRFGCILLVSFDSLAHRLDFSLPQHTPLLVEYVTAELSASQKSQLELFSLEKTHFYELGPDGEPIRELGLCRGSS